MFMHEYYLPTKQKLHSFAINHVMFCIHFQSTHICVCVPFPDRELLIHHNFRATSEGSGYTIGTSSTLQIYQCVLWKTPLTFRVYSFNGFSFPSDVSPHVGCRRALILKSVKAMRVWGHHHIHHILQTKD
jgi:hypothetical protein